MTPTRMVVRMINALLVVFALMGVLMGKQRALIMLGIIGSCWVVTRILEEGAEAYQRFLLSRKK